MFKNANSSIGLDISDLTIKLVQLKRSGDKIKLQAISKENLPPRAIENGEIKNQEPILKAIDRLLNKPKFGSVNTNEVVACLPSTKTFIKLIDIEKTTNTLHKIVASELEKHIPYQAKEVYFDWQLISESADEYHVLIGAAPKNIVNQYLALLKNAKLSISALEIESISICRGLLQEEAKKYSGNYDKNYCLIDIGAGHSSIIIYSKNSIILSLSVPVCGDDATVKIAKTLEIKTEQAEKAKIICGLDKAQAHGIVSDILSEMVGALNSKINETIEFFTHHYPELGPINKILLTGGGSHIRNINNIINEATSIPTTQANSFVNLNESLGQNRHQLTETHRLNAKNQKKSKTEKDAYIKQDASRSYASAIGLALRSMFIE